MTWTADMDRLAELPVITKLLVLLAVRNAVRGGVDEATLLQSPDTETLTRLLETNELRSSTAAVPWRLHLRPLEPDDLEVIYRAWCDPEAGALWRSAGSTPAWSELEAQLWAGTDTLLVGEQIESREPGVLLCSYSENPGAGWSYVAILRLDLAGAGGPFLAMEGLYLLLHHLFRTKPYRKIMLEIPARTFWMAERVVPDHDVSVFPRHRYANGEWVDVAHVHLWRDHWKRLASPVELDPALLAQWLNRHVCHG